MNSRMLSALVLCATSARSGESPAVRLVPAQAAQASNREVVTGQLNASKLLPLGFEVGGRVSTSKVTKGEVVKAGQFLGSLDTEIIDAQVAQIRDPFPAHFFVEELRETGVGQCNPPAGRDAVCLVVGGAGGVPGHPDEAADDQP